MSLSRHTYPSSADSHFSGTYFFIEHLPTLCLILYWMLPESWLFFPVFQQLLLRLKLHQWSPFLEQPPNQYFHINSLRDCPKIAWNVSFCILESFVLLDKYNNIVSPFIWQVFMLCQLPLLITTLLPTPLLFHFMQKSFNSHQTVSIITLGGKDGSVSPYFFFSSSF